LWFEDGKVKAYGSAEEIISQYEKFLTPPEVEIEAEQHPASESRARAAEAVPEAAAAEQEQETTSSTEVEQDAAVSRRELRHAPKKRRNSSPLIKIAIIIHAVVALV